MTEFEFRAFCKIRGEIPNADQDVNGNKRAASKNVADDPIGGPLEQNYVDDLRTGAFHFVKKREIEFSEHAKPYQVILQNFTKGTRNSRFNSSSPRKLKQVLRLTKILRCSAG